MPIGDKSYTVEINDSEFEREGWKNGRYKGTKLTAAKINQFQKGDISFGTEPVIEQYSKTVYVFNQADHSFSSKVGVFYPPVDEFGAELTDKDIIGSTRFKIDRAVQFTIDEPSNFSQLEPGVDENDPSFRLFDTSLKHDLAVFNNCSVRFFNNANNGVVRPSYTVGYNRGEFEAAAAYLRKSGSNSVITVKATASNEAILFVNDIQHDSLLDGQNAAMSNGARLYVNPNIEEWFIAQDGASGSQGTILGGNPGIVIDHAGSGSLPNGGGTSFVRSPDDVNSLIGYMHGLRDHIAETNERYYISFNTGLDAPGTFNQKNTLLAHDVKRLLGVESFWDGIGTSFRAISIETTGRNGAFFEADYNDNNKNNEFIIFKQRETNNVVHLNFNLITDAPAGIGTGGVIIPNNLHPKIKEQLNVYLSNAGLGAIGGVQTNFGLGDNINIPSETSPTTRPPLQTVARASDEILNEENQGGPR